VTSVKVRLWSSNLNPGQILECLNPVVTVANTEVECDLPEGSGASLDVQVTTGGQASNFEKVFSFEAPVIENVRPVRAQVGQTVTVSGRNFGNNERDLQFRFNGVVVNSNFFNITVNHTELQFEVPLGTGAAIPLAMRLPVFINSGLVTQDNIPVIPAPNNSITFNYAKPVVFRVTPAGTQGGTVTVVGDNFGALGGAFLDGVRIGSVLCTTPVVTVANTQLECALQAGSGRDLNLVVTVNGQASDAWPFYQYLPPFVQLVPPLLLNSPPQSSIYRFTHGFTAPTPPFTAPTPPFTTPLLNSPPHSSINHPLLFCCSAISMVAYGRCGKNGRTCVGPEPGQNV
jgi:hypothetical protein